MCVFIGLPGERFYIGGRKSDSIWSWTDGSAWNYERWEKDIEKNRDGEWVTIFLGSKKWKSVSLDWKGNYLCQYTL